MHISLAESCTKGFNKWCAAHDAGRKDDDGPGVDDAIVNAKLVLDPSVIALPEQPHRPWLVPGAGRL